jgi:2-hydroxyglutarate dehydrogenase
MPACTTPQARSKRSFVARPRPNSRPVAPRDLVRTLRYPGFRRLARRYLRAGLAELGRDWWKPAFVADLRRYIPEIRATDLRSGPSGVRAQAVSADGQLLDDFVFGGRGRVVHVRNAPSPAATSSLAIGRRVAGMVLERLAG